MEEDVTASKIKLLRGKLSEGQPNNPLKPTATRVTLFAAKANSAPRYGGLVPPFYCIEYRRNRITIE